MPVETKVNGLISTPAVALIKLVVVVKVRAAACRTSVSVLVATEAVRELEATKRIG